MPNHIFQQTENYFANHLGETGLRVYLGLFGVGLILLSVFAPTHTSYVIWVLAGVAAYVTLP